jgi:hypothetical protein
MKYIYAVYYRINGKSAGFGGYYKTKAEAQKCDRTLPFIIKRESVPIQFWQNMEVKK